MAHFKVHDSCQTIDQSSPGSRSARGGLKISVSMNCCCSVVGFSHFLIEGADNGTFVLLLAGAICLAATAFIGGATGGAGAGATFVTIGLAIAMTACFTRRAGTLAAVLTGGSAGGRHFICNHCAVGRLAADRPCGGLLNERNNLGRARLFLPGLHPSADQRDDDVD